MLYLSRFSLTLMISFTLTFSQASFADSLAHGSNLIENLDLNEKKINSNTHSKIEKSKKRIAKAFDRKIAKAKRQKNSLNKALMNLEISLEQSFVDALKTKRRLLKKDKITKISRKLKQFSGEAKVEEVKSSLNELTNRSRFQEVKEELMTQLKNAGSEVKFLEQRKAQTIQSIQTAQTHKITKKSRSIASTLSFSEIFTFIAVCGLTAYGIITLSAIGTALAITGVILLSILAVVLLFMAIMCAGVCYIPPKKESEFIS